MSGNIIYLDEIILKKTIVRENNRIIISGKDGSLTIFLNKYIPKKLDFILHPIKFWEFVTNSYNNYLTKNVQPEDCRQILIESIERLSIRSLSPEDVWKRICDDILNSKNFQYSFAIGIPFSKKPSTIVISYIFVLKT